jgi:ABC-type transport system involved in multi-copper enzyme maturation permease subunit
MKTIGTIAVNVFRESVRDKVLYNLVFFAILLIGASYLISELTAGQDVKVIKDLGLSAIAIFGLFMAVFIGVGLVSKEVERRSIYAILSKPVRRETFVFGKYCGLVLTLLVNVAVMTVSLYAVLALFRWFAPAWRAVPEAPNVDPELLKAIVCIFVELMLVTAVAVLFSTFSTPMLSATLTIGLWVVGPFNADLKGFGSVVASPTAAAITKGLYYVVPNFAAFDVKWAVVHGEHVGAGYIWLTTAYGFVYIALLLTVSMFVFARRDFK